uniref:Acetoacetyl-CoA synthetase n=1 Tax=Suricata suricatta TaxID=37032 RepID=A0A673VPT4_SURSU
MSKEPRAGREEILECQVMWEPDGKKNTQMDRFRAAVGAAFGLALENYDDLYHWSVESYSDFWATFWKFSGIVFSRMYDEVVDTSKGIADVPEWFRGSRLNYAENLLRHEENDKVALYAAREGREEIVKVTFGELRQQVALFAAAMRKMGVKRGDRVVGYLPNGVHAVEAMLAAASIGAIWSSTSPDFGVNGVLDRFSQIQPRLIFSVEAVMYNGKEFGHLDKLLQVVKGLPDLERVVLIPYLNFSIPVYRGEIQARNLGMAVEAWSEEGKAVWGESGELVCTKPLPCQPTHFWNDENGSKYRKAYFSRFPGVWAHGDYCRINPKTGGIIMLGRSDGTLNPNGVRFGSSEIYNIVEAFEEVVDSLCVPQYSKDGEERVLLFLKMASGHTFGPALASSIRSAIRRGLSARHVPSLILETKGIPYTLNGKKVEVAVKQVIAGRAVEHRGAFLNPETLDLYRDIPELQGF